MELGVYVRRIMRRWWVIVLVALVAAGGTFGYFAGLAHLKNQYRATVDLAVPASQSGTAGGSGQYVANFGVGLTMTSVLDEVSAATGVSVSDLSSGLSNGQLGNSGFINVTYSDPDQARAIAVAHDAAVDTAGLLSEGAVEQARTAQSAAKTQLNQASAQQVAAQQALAGYQAKYGYVNPDVTYQAAQTSITQLNVSKQQAIADGHPTAGFSAAIAAQQAQLTGLAEQEHTYDALAGAVTQADSAVQSAQNLYSAGAQQVSVATTPPTLEEATTTRVTATSTEIKGSGIAAGVGLVLGLAAVMLIELMVGRQYADGR